MNDETELLSQSPSLQGTEQWIKDRIGKATASRISDALAKIKSGWGASRANYAAELIMERLTDLPYPQYVSQAMAWGTQHEPEAVATYSLMIEEEVTTVGFVPHPTIPMAGASPDRLVGEAGLAEFKCPNTATHIATLMGGSIPNEYIIQMQFQMACTWRHWCDWNSYDPRMPVNMRLFTKRIYRDQAYIREIEGQVAAFLKEVDNAVDQLKSRYA